MLTHLSNKIAFVSCRQMWLFKDIQDINKLKLSKTNTLDVSDVWDISQMNGEK